MKKQAITLMLFALLAIGKNASAQTGTDYFVGQWDVLVKGLPDGDATLRVTFYKEGEKIAGKMVGKDNTETIFSSVEPNGNSVTARFTAQGFDVYLRLDKAADDKITGTMLDMFDASGVRVNG